jgi:hypothetical protein
LANGKRNIERQSDRRQNMRKRKKVGEWEMKVQMQRRKRNC